MRNPLADAFVALVALLVPVAIVFADIVYTETHANEEDYIIVRTETEEFRVKRPTVPAVLHARGRTYTIHTNGLVTLRGTNVTEKGETIYNEN